MGNRKRERRIECVLKEAPLTLSKFLTLSSQRLLLLNSKFTPPSPFQGVKIVL